MLSGREWGAYPGPQKGRPCQAAQGHTWRCWHADRADEWCGAQGHPGETIVTGWAWRVLKPTVGHLPGLPASLPRVDVPLTAHGLKVHLKHLPLLSSVSQSPDVFYTQIPSTYT